MPPTPMSYAETRYALDMLLTDRRLLTGRHANPSCVSLRGACAHCSQPHTIGTVPISGLVAFLSGGTLIQDCFPTLSSSDREFILTRTCPTCWNRIFGPPDLSST